MRKPADLEDRRADLEAGARGQVLGTQVEVDVELVARERPALPIASCHEVDDARVHECDLGGSSVVVGTVRSRSSRTPAIPDEAVLEIEYALLEDLALALDRAPYDELDRPYLGRRRENVLETSPELIVLDVDGHGPERYRSKT